MIENEKGMASSDKPSSKETWSSGPGLDPDIVFPECRSLTTKLPDIKTTLGLIKFHVRVGTGKIRHVGEVLREVSKLVYSKWHITVLLVFWPLNPAVSSDWSIPV